MTEKKIIQTSISIFGFLVIICHIIWPTLKIDSITVILIIIIVIPWLAPIFKSFELPGGLKVEYPDIDIATKKLVESGLISKNKQGEKKKHHSKYTFLNVVDLDSKLALSGLRMEIESRLVSLATFNSIKSESVGVYHLTNGLTRKGVLDINEASAIHDVLPILNNAVHGKSVDKRTHDWAIEIGPQILDSLEAKIGSHKLPDIIEAFKKSDGGGITEMGYELSRQLFKSPIAFFELMSKDREAFFNWFDRLQNNTFTMYNVNDEIDELLEYEKHRKLKDLLIEKVTEYLKDNKYNQDAIMVLNKLNELEIRSIW